MVEKKGSLVRRHRRRPQPKRGVWLGRLVFLVLGIAGTLFYLEVREVGFESAVQNLQAYFRKDVPQQPVVLNPLTGGRVFEPEDADTRPLHEQDSRWDAAVALGEAGIQQRDDALHEHYDGEGDPFILREQTNQAFDKINRALVDLRAMREEYGSSEYSRMKLDFQIARFEKIADNIHDKSNRR